MSRIVLDEYILCFYLHNLIGCQVRSMEMDDGTGMVRVIENNVNGDIARNLYK